MAKQDTIEVQGKIIEKKPGMKFTVEIETVDPRTNKKMKHIIEAHVSGKIRMNYIRILPGDTVTVEMSPYDLEHGRITFRNK